MKKRIQSIRHVIAGVTLLAIISPSATVGSQRRIEGPTQSGFEASNAELRVRKDVKRMTAQERREFVDAILALKSVPSPYDSTLSYYDQFVAWHLALYPCGMNHEAMRPHGGPMFLPWHRLFVLRFEDALRKVSGKAVTVPYWDWSDPSSTTAVFSDDFMGGDGDPDDGFAVKTGPFRKGEWELRVHPVGLQWSASATPHLTRRFGSFPGFETLPTREDVRWLLDRPRYDVVPYDPASDPNISFRNAIEGFWQPLGDTKVAAGSMACGPDGVMNATSGPGAHNLVHVWVGGLLEMTLQGPKAGTMVLPTSTNDPVFFLHHANIDRLWAGWQATRGIDSHEPASCDPALPEPGCLGNSMEERMHPPFDATPADVADIRALGYGYDTVDATPRAVGRSAKGEQRVARAIAPSYRCDLRRNLTYAAAGRWLDVHSVEAPSSNSSTRSFFMR